MNGLKKMRQNTIENDKWLARLIMLACFMSNISQLSFLVTAGMTQMLNMPGWILLLGYLLITKQLYLTYQMAKPLCAMFAVIVGLLFCTLFSGGSYFNSSVFSCLSLSLFIFLMGGITGSSIMEEELQKILWAYALSAFLVSIDIYTNYFASGFNLSSRIYAYSSKNSVSQVILTSIFILMFLDVNGHRVMNGLKTGIILFEIFLMALLKSRATILGFLCCLVYIVIGRQFNRKLKRRLLFAVVVGIVVLLTNNTVSEIFFNQILFAGRDVTDLDSLSSGRVSILKSFPMQIEGHWLVGAGALYYECFPLSVILQFGIIVGPIILGISYLPIVKCLFYKRDSMYMELFAVICIVYAINSLFEGLAPIGPGTKCYFMWLLYGLILGQKERQWMMQEEKEEWQV